MKPTFQPRLINGPFGDPGLHVGFRWRGDAFQFDLGKIDRLPAAEVHKVSRVFVSHTHIDHFIGFDRLVRLFLARDARLDLFGPPGILDNVRGKLAGYTWNLVEGYPFILDVHEVHEDRILALRMRATTAFKPEPLPEREFEGLLCEDDSFRVRAVHLDHRIPCLGFAVIEKSHLNVRKDELERTGIPPGRWLNDLKDAIRRKAADDTVITAHWRQDGEERHVDLRVGELRDRLVVETRGQKLAYVVDTIFSRENVPKVVELARGADLFYCESLFVDADRDQALKRYHMTARQAGTLARLADVKRLEVFHFSPRYDGQAGRIYNEAAATFRGELEPDTPV